MPIRQRELPDIRRRTSSESTFRYTGTERTNVPANQPHTNQLARPSRCAFDTRAHKGNGTYNNSITQWCSWIPTAVSRTRTETATQLSRRRAPRTSLRSSFATSSGSRLAVGSAGSAASANISSSSSALQAEELPRSRPQEQGPVQGLPDSRGPRRGMSSESPRWGCGALGCCAARSWLGREKRGAAAGRLGASVALVALDTVGAVGAPS